MFNQKRKIMKKNLLLAGMFLFSFGLFTACGDEEPEGDQGVELVGGTSNNIQFAASDTAGIYAKGIKFVTTGPWRADVEDVSASKSTRAVDWLTLSQYSGNAAGTYDVKVTLLPNYGTQDRKALIRIICDGFEIVITIVQKSAVEGGEGQVQAKVVKQLIIESNYGEGWKKYNYDEFEKTSYSFFYDDKQRVARVERIEEDNNQVDKEIYTFDYNVVGEITIVKNQYDQNSSEPSTERYTVTLDKQGRALRMTSSDEHTDDNCSFGYNEQGQLAKVTYDGYDDEIEVRYEYQDGLLNKYVDIYNNKIDTVIIPLKNLYPNRYSAYTTNIDLNALDFYGDDEAEALLHMFRMTGVGSKCLFEIAMMFGGESDIAHAVGGYAIPGITVQEESFGVREPESGFAPIIYNFDKNNYVTDYYWKQPYQVIKRTWDVVVSNELVDPRHPELGYKYEIRNEKTSMIGNEENTHTYKVIYQE